MTYTDIYRLLNERNLIIFGTGFVAGQLYYALEEKNLADRIKCFTVTECRENTVFRGKPVIVYRNVDVAEDDVVLAAVHPSAFDTLPQKDGVQMISVNSFLCDMLYGPALREEMIPTNRIRWHQNEDEYWIAVRYAAIRSYFLQESMGRHVYLKAMQLHCSRETAERRLQYFIRLMKTVTTKGYDQTKPIFLTEDDEVIDGLHRLAIAAYTGLRAVNCRVYPNSEKYYELLDERNRVSELFLRESGFTDEEIDYLKACTRICG